MYTRKKHKDLNKYSDCNLSVYILDFSQKPAYVYGLKIDHGSRASRYRLQETCTYCSRRIVLTVKQGAKIGEDQMEKIREDKEEGAKG
jgi:hypothetical protein